MNCSNKNQIIGFVMVSHNEMFESVYTNIIDLKKKLKAYANTNGADEQYHLAIMFLNNAMEKAYKNKGYCENLFLMFAKYSTIRLRSNLSLVGCDYWGNLKHGNACDLIDALMCK